MAEIAETGEPQVPQEPAEPAQPAEPAEAAPSTPVALPTVPKLTSRKCGSLVCWVVDRGALARDPCASPVSPPPKARGAARDESPETPSFKPCLPPRIVLKGQDESGEADAKKVDEDEAPENPEDPDSDGSETETYSPSCSPCSDGPRPSFGYGIPMWPCYFPMEYQAPWYDVNDLAAQHLEACHSLALKRAARRGAPTKESCGIGCCCTRCIGVPAAFAQPEKNTKKRKKPEERDEQSEDENQGQDCDVVSVDSQQTQPTDSSTSDSDMDVEAILNQLPPSGLKWITSDPCLMHLTGTCPRRTVVCTRLHPEATAMDVQQAFEHRFLSVPDFVDGYWKKGLTSMAVVTVRIDAAARRCWAQQCFVAFYDETLASTALLFQGLEICGQRVQLRRPHEYLPLSDDAPALDISILYRLGMLSRQPHEPAAPPGPNGATSKAAAKPPGRSGLRHLYIGNLPKGHQSLQDVTELVTCIASELSSYKAEVGPPMISASPKAEGEWVVEMQSAELARNAHKCLQQMVLDGVQPSVYLTFGPER